jgi:hypothetical protein
VTESWDQRHPTPQRMIENSGTLEIALCIMCSKPDWPHQLPSWASLELEVPDADVLIHAGDLMMSSDELKEIIDFNERLGNLPSLLSVNPQPIRRMESYPSYSVSYTR